MRARPSARRGLRSAVAVGVLALAISGCTSNVRGTVRPGHDLGRSPTPTTPAGPAMVPAATAKDLLLKGSELGAIVGDTDMRQTGSITDTDVLPLPVEPLPCQYVIGTARSSGYYGSGREATVGDMNRGAADQLATQVVTVFDSRDAGEQLLAGTNRDWSNPDCPEGEPFTVTETVDDEDKVSHWVPAAVDIAETRVGIGYTRQEDPPRSCYHVVTFKANVGIETVSCGDGDVKAKASQLADQIAAKVPA